MPISPLSPREALELIDARHDELILKLDYLNAQIEAALAEFSTRRETQQAADAVFSADLPSTRRSRKAA